MDVWKEEVHDPRYDKVLKQMETVNSIDPNVLISHVLNYPGVQTSLTIFSAGMLP